MKVLSFSWSLSCKCGGSFGLMMEKREEGVWNSVCCWRQKATCMIFTDLIECGSIKKRCSRRKEITKELHLMELKRRDD